MQIRAPRRTAALAVGVLVLPLVAVAASAAPQAAVAQAPGRTPTLPSTVTPLPGLTVEDRRIDMQARSTTTSPESAG